MRRLLEDYCPKESGSRPSTSDSEKIHEELEVCSSDMQVLGLLLTVNRLAIAELFLCSRGLGDQSSTGRK